jgi:predicted transcriptional regulator
VHAEGLTDLQLSVMKALWRLSEASAAEIQTEMASAGRELAPTTVATLLQRLAKQGWVKSRRNGRQLLYRAQVDEAKVAEGALKRLVRSFFGGKVSVLAAQLLESEQLSAEDLRRLKSLIAKKES